MIYCCSKVANDLVVITKQRSHHFVIVLSNVYDKLECRAICQMLRYMQAHMLLMRKSSWDNHSKRYDYRGEFVYIAVSSCMSSHELEYCTYMNIGTHMRLTSESIQAKIHVLLCACKLQPTDRHCSHINHGTVQNASGNLSRVHLRVELTAIFRCVLSLLMPLQNTAKAQLRL